MKACSLSMASKSARFSRMNAQVRASLSECAAAMNILYSCLNTCHFSSMSPLNINGSGLWNPSAMVIDLAFDSCTTLAGCLLCLQSTEKTLPYCVVGSSLVHNQTSTSDTMLKDERCNWVQDSKITAFTELLVVVLQASDFLWS